MCTEVFEHSIKLSYPPNIKHTACVRVCPCVRECTLKPWKLIGRSKFDRKTVSFKDDFLQYKPGEKK